MESFKLLLKWVCIILMYWLSGVILSAGFAFLFALIGVEIVPYGTGLIILLTIIYGIYWNIRKSII
ncbi:hypothetical protein [Gottfriedia acidiceleris]|uniref:hypothetical protein n=1 Tax=Gottfriedia acidiceleris TaxID=371036 RepID=UPI000B43BE1E|nr:hypothetical protein [Gottfriedia acidiceleris]